MQELFMYDATVFGFERQAFMTGSHVRVTIDSEGSIVGYTVTRPTFFKESNKIGPLFADSETVAETSLKAEFEELPRQQEGASVVCVDASTEKATKLCERLLDRKEIVCVSVYGHERSP